jgi:hypothetical protein
VTAHARRTPPDFCQYAAGPCDQTFDDIPSVQGTFLYPNGPQHIADTIEQAVEQLRGHSSKADWVTWKDFNITGSIIFCTICKQMRFSRLVVVDVTTLNFNLMFELGVAIGLGLPVIPIRDTTIDRDKQNFADLGLIDTLGYQDFQNAIELSACIQKCKDTTAPLPEQTVQQNLAAPLYFLKAPIGTQGAVTLESCIEQSGLKKRNMTSWKAAFHCKRLEGKSRARWALSVIC